MPSISPNRIQSLFSGNRISALTTVIIKNNNDIIPNIYSHGVVVNLLKYAEANANTSVKKNPNFLFEGSSICENIIVYALWILLKCKKYNLLFSI